MTQNIFRFVALGFALTLLSLADASAEIKYVALGDSLTAGWQSGCLVQRNQVNSYPAVLARQFGVTDFEQPLVQETALTDPMGTACLGAVFIPPATISVGFVSQMGLPLNLLLPRPYDNLGLPGAEVKDLIHLTHGDPDGTDLEKISALVLRNVTGSPFDGTNAVQQADALIAGALGDTTIVTLWIGNNDVLGASTSGIVVDGVTLTSAEDFASGYHDILAALLPADTFVVANIPDVTSIPFSSTIPPILVNPTTRQPVIINGSTVPLLGQGDDAFPCTPVAPDQGCPLPAGSLVNLPASSLLAAGTGIPVAAGGNGVPLPHGFIGPDGPHAGVTLYPDEVALLQARTAEYNSTISSLVLGGTVIDVNGLFANIKAHGYPVGGLTLTTTFLTGGIFSYDGVHPSTIGYTVVADVFIQAMNASAGTSFPRPNFSDVLFTPNLPNLGNAVTDGGPWQYSFSTWESLLSQLNPLRGTKIQLPSARASVAPANRGGSRGQVRPVGSRAAAD